MPKPSKYLNKKTIVGQIEFDSKKEAARYGALLMLEKAGEIRDLVLQPSFEISSKQVNEHGKPSRARYYVADFAYTDSTGKRVIEDVKSPTTRKNPVYSLKKHLMLEKHGITIREM